MVSWLVFACFGNRLKRLTRRNQPDDDAEQGREAENPGATQRTSPETPHRETEISYDGEGQNKDTHTVNTQTEGQKQTAETCCLQSESAGGEKKEENIEGKGTHSMRYPHIYTQVSVKDVFNKRR